MTKREKILCGFAGVFTALGIVCRFVPSIKFTAYLCGGIACLFAAAFFLSRWAKRSKVGRGVLLAFCVCLVVGLASFAVTEIVLVHAGGKVPPVETPGGVIVLGAGVNGTVPSLALSTRLDRAIDYLKTIPDDVPVVLSGGQGAGEDITEAEAMYVYLTARGVDGGRLHREEHSVNTEQNLAYSRDLLEKLGVEPTREKIAVVTNDFHVFRARLLAKGAELDVFGVPAPLPYLGLSANYYAREYFALIKTILF